MWTVLPQGKKSKPKTTIEMFLTITFSFGVYAHSFLEVYNTSLVVGQRLSFIPTYTTLITPATNPVMDVTTWLLVFFQRIQQVLAGGLVMHFHLGITSFRYDLETHSDTSLVATTMNQLP